MAIKEIKKKNILITGGDSQLANSIKLNKNYIKYFNLIFLDKKKLDITNRNKIVNVINYYRPHAIINTAAFTDVQKSQSNQKLAEKINYIGVKNLTNISKKYNIILLHFSTDYVFYGKIKKSYEEVNKTIPKNLYGISKLKGENYIKKILKKYLIIRVSWLFGHGKNNFVFKIIDKSKSNNSITVVENEYSSPTCAIDLANTVLTILYEILIYNNNNFGIYHYNSLDKKISRYQFAKMIINKISNIEISNTKIYKIKINDNFRPFNSFLNTRKIYNKFNIKRPDFNKSLKQMINYYLERLK